MMQFYGHYKTNHMEKNQTAARIIKIESPYDILNNVIDTDTEGFYEE